ncbi:MAG: bifunctional enoyl-CoA hydratase/phosphate acetyltransferase [Negativicutes bacterium]|nr:bifunctional enoyl-CoA hydratase/phosphate acetyltransferase [Negativicutes bacterium]
MAFQTFDQLIRFALERQTQKTVAAVCPDDPATLQALFDCQQQGLLRVLFVGEQEKIRRLWLALGGKTAEIEIIDTADKTLAAERAVAEIRAGRADFLMKGNLETAVLLKAVVDKAKGLRSGQLISHLAFLQIPGYPKLIVLTDSGMVLKPDLSQKKAILLNAVLTLQSLGYPCPKVGILAAVEKVNPSMPETLDAAALTAMNRSGELPGCWVEGPISYDLLISREIAEKKGYSSPIVGDADIMLVSDMTSGNLLGKALTVSAHAEMAGLIVGASVPIALTSRGSHRTEKRNSLILAAICC